MRSLRSISIVFASTAVAVGLLTLFQRKQTKRKKQTTTGSDDCCDESLASLSAYESLVGNTPMVRLPKLSAILGREIFVKMESLNPGGTGKDRAALAMIRAAEESEKLPRPWANGSGEKLRMQGGCTGDSSLDAALIQAMKHSRTGGLVVEGTSGSTGISLGTLCASRGHACLVVMPDDQAIEKQGILKTLGVVVHVVPNVAISNPKHYVNVARRLADRARTEWGIPAVFMDQFENAANYQVHYEQTGSEIMRQLSDLNAFVMSSGTGGTISGVGRYLKENGKSDCRVVLVDPPGSALYNKIEHGVAYASEQRERGLKRHRYDTLAEGIGLDRVTHNLAFGVDCIDGAIRVTDQEAVDMAHWILEHEGLWVGSSSAMNLVGAVRTALDMPAGAKVVTVVCDNGTRHLTRFWNQKFCLEWGLEWPGDTSEVTSTRIPECLKLVETSGGKPTDK